MQLPARPIEIRGLETNPKSQEVALETDAYGHYDVQLVISTGAQLSDERDERDR